MSPVAVAVLVGTIGTIVAIAVVLRRQGHAESAAGHRARLDDPADGSMLRAPGSRPGGPGQAGQYVVAPGEIAPGDPEADS